MEYAQRSTARDNAAGRTVADADRPATAEATATELVAQADAAPTPILNWATCTEPGLDRFQCATARVPLDYAKPDGATLDLAVVRQPATDSDRRIGTLFSAAGGPGGSGIDAARDIGLGSPELAQRFDLVTFDQRGIGRSAQVRCFADTAAQEDFWSRYAPLPTSQRQYDDLERLSRELADSCAAHSGELLPTSPPSTPPAIWTCCAAPSATPPSPTRADPMPATSARCTGRCSASGSARSGSAP